MVLSVVLLRNVSFYVSFLSARILFAVLPYGDYKGNRAALLLLRKGPAAIWQGQEVLLGKMQEQLS